MFPGVGGLFLVTLMLPGVGVLFSSDLDVARHGSAVFV